MLSFVWSESDKSVRISCDGPGMDRLIETLEHLREHGGHVHLRTAGAGGNDLNAVSPWGEPAIDEVIITGDGDDWSQEDAAEEDGA